MKRDEITGFEDFRDAALGEVLGQNPCPHGALAEAGYRLRERDGYHVTEDGMGSLTSAVAWLMGYLDGTGREIPEFVIKALERFIDSSKNG